jgi:hypothetical protein
VLYQLGRDQKILAVIDEFPFLLPEKREDRNGVLSQIQAVMEERRDPSQTKVMLCGSLIGQMERPSDLGQADPHLDPSIGAGRGRCLAGTRRSRRHFRGPPLLAHPGGYRNPSRPRERHD